MTIELPLREVTGVVFDGKRGVISGYQMLCGHVSTEADLLQRNQAYYLPCYECYRETPSIIPTVLTQAQWIATPLQSKGHPW